MELLPVCRMVGVARRRGRRLALATLANILEAALDLDAG